MKKITLLIHIALFAFSTYCFSQNEIEINNLQKVTQTDPWTKLTGLQYAMPIYAQVNKDGVLFQPTGLLLGVFKNNLCYGFSGLSTGPKGKYHNITVGCNNVSEDGFTYKVYDPNSSLFYDISETLSFKNLTPVGGIAAPAQLHISGISALNSPEIDVISISPNPIKNEFTIFLNRQDAEMASISIFDLTGKIISNLTDYKIKETGEISIVRDNNIKNGIYFIQLKVGNKTYTEKLIFI